MKIRMKFKKATLHTYVYQEVDSLGLPESNASVPTLYIKQHALPSRPEYIEVTIGRTGEAHG